MDSDRFNTGYENIQKFGNKFINGKFFTPPELKMSYNKSSVIFARTRDGKLFSLDISEGFRAFIVGATRCLEENTLIKTIDGDKKIKDLIDGDLVLSYNFLEHKKEFKEIKKFEMQEQECYEIEFENGNKISASSEHKFYFLENYFPITCYQKKVKDLKIEDRLICQVANLILYEGIKKIKKVGIKNTYDIEVKDNHNFFLSNGILSHNSGKTFMMRSIADRLKKSGLAVCFLTDIKDEFKCLNVNQKIMTAKGKKKICKLKPNKDKVLGYKNGEIIECNFNKSTVKEMDCYEIELEDGRKIKCTAEHKFFKNCNTKPMQETELKNLKIGDKIFTLNSCVICKKVYSKEQKTCSRKCGNILKSKTQMGINNPNYNNKWTNDMKKSLSEKCKKHIAQFGHPKGMLNKKHSKKSLQLMSEVKIGNKNSMFGRTHDDSAKSLMKRKAKNRKQLHLIGHRYRQLKKAKFRKKIGALKNLDNNRENFCIIRKNKSEKLFFNDIYFRTIHELYFAKFCYENNINFKYENYIYKLNHNNNVLNYCPDFYLIDYNMYIEICSYIGGFKKIKFKLFGEQVGKILFISNNDTMNYKLLGEKIGICKN